MRSAVHVMFALLMVLTGLPHAFCACGCAGEAGHAATHPAAPACPHCRPPVQDRSGHEVPQPCQCHHCSQVQATRPESTMQAAQLEPGDWLVAAPHAVAVPSAAVANAELAFAHGPPDWLAASPRDIPILLGRLLL